MTPDAGGPNGATGDARLELLRDWLATALGLGVPAVMPASADASFRRYFRVQLADGTRIVMDAPPDKEDIEPYLRVGALMHGAGARVPQVYAVDRTQGFVLLEDFGATSFLSEVRKSGRAETLYPRALTALAELQARGGDAAAQLAPYDTAVLQREMALLPEWFCTRHLAREPDVEERELFARTFDFLVDAALEQPQVFVHRDYHSRNLMVMPGDALGMIDFQDALRGPIGYDLVSLLKDCYIDWPREQVVAWLRAHRDTLRRAGCEAAIGVDEEQFIRWFDLIGVQRHVKVLGIFARLAWRDQKSGYLDDLPLTLRYVQESCARYPELAAFGAWLARRAAPELAAANERARAYIDRSRADA